MQTKDEVLMRANYRCVLCGWGGASSIVEVHHLIPKAEGGDDMTINQIVLCPNHHALVTALIANTINRETLLETAGDHTRMIVAVAKIAAYTKLLDTVKGFDDEELIRDLRRVQEVVHAQIEEVKNQISS